MSTSEEPEYIHKKPAQNLQANTRQVLDYADSSVDQSDYRQQFLYAQQHANQGSNSDSNSDNDESLNSTYLKQDAQTKLMTFKSND